jgi:hypothetical protein
MQIAEASSAPEGLEENQEDSSIIKSFENRLTLIYEDFQKHNDFAQMKMDFQDLFKMMKQEASPEEINEMKKETRFYEMFYTLGEV